MPVVSQTHSSLQQGGSKSFWHNFDEKHIPYVMYYAIASIQQRQSPSFFSFPPPSFRELGTAYSQKLNVSCALSIPVGALLNQAPGYHQSLPAAFITTCLFFTGLSVTFHSPLHLCTFSQCFLHPFKQLHFGAFSVMF